MLDLPAIWPEKRRRTKLANARAAPSRLFHAAKQKERDQLTGQSIAFNRISNNGR
jgi:hypothetical protein